MIPLSCCRDPVSDKQFVETVALYRSKSSNKLEFVDAVIDAAAGTKHTENTFMKSVVEALGAGITCDFGASLSKFFNQFLRPYIRFFFSFCFVCI